MGSFEWLHGVLGGPLGVPWASLGALWGSMGPPWGLLGRPCAHPGGPGASRVRSWEHLGALLGARGGEEAAVAAVPLSFSKMLIFPPWDALGRPWGALGAPLGRPWGVLGRPWAVPVPSVSALERPWAPLSAPERSGAKTGRVRPGPGLAIPPGTSLGGLSPLLQRSAR